MTDKDKIKKILESRLRIHTIKIIDESQAHAGHNTDAAHGGTHIQLLIVSDDFKGKSLIQRHRMIYKILEDEFKAGLHALAIKALTSEEARSS